MAELKIVFTADRITELEVDTWVALKSNDVSVRAARDLAIVFVVDDNDNYLPEDEARVLIGQLKIRQLFDIFGEIAKGVEEEAIPPATGG